MVDRDLDGEDDIPFDPSVIGPPRTPTNTSGGGSTKPLGSGSPNTTGSSGSIGSPSRGPQIGSDGLYDKRDFRDVKTANVGTLVEVKRQLCIIYDINPDGGSLTGFAGLCRIVEYPVAYFTQLDARITHNGELAFRFSPRKTTPPSAVAVVRITYERGPGKGKYERVTDTIPFTILEKSRLS